MSAPPENHPIRTLQDHLCFDLYVASRAVIKAHRPLLDQLGLTYPQYLVMVCLWQYGAQTVSDLGERLALDSGTLSPLLKRLEAAGLLRRARQQADERAVEVSLTDQGNALQARAAELPDRLACLMGLSESEGRSLQDVLRTLTSHLEQAGR